MNTPWMLITGCLILGFVLPEIFGILGRVEIPILLNIMFAISFGLIAASFV